ncbi:hypothetical protein MKX03_001525 [Papaver bracteatum]|nr:hypothetical protein MKX03_001525 [Papaver bracteatum]
MLSISEMAFGVSRADQLVPKVPSESKPVVLEAPVNLQDGEVRRGGSLGLTTKNGVVHVDNGGSHGLNLEKGEVLEGSRQEDVEIVNGVGCVKRSHETTTNYKTGQVAMDFKTEANVPAVTTVNVGAPVEVDTKNRTSTKDAPAMKKSDGNYK